MVKLKKAVPREAFTVKSSNMSIIKKQKKKNDKWSSDKNNFEILSSSNEDAFTSKENSKRKKKHGNKLDVKGTEKSYVLTKNDKKHKMKNKDKLAKNLEKLDVLTKYSRNDQRTSEIFQKIQNSKIKRKKRDNEGKQDTNSDCLNKNAVEVNNKKERRKKLQMSTEELINLKHKKNKIEKFKKLSEKRIKRMSVEAKAQQIRSDKVLKFNKHMIKIKQLEEMLVNKLQEARKALKAKKALKSKITQLTAARFRLINKMLYNNNSSQSECYFKENPDAFEAYQAGYELQLKQWMMNPLDVIISAVKKLSIDIIIADFGCGKAQLAASVPHTVYSFDFIALNDRVRTCDMVHTPLRTDSVHVVVFCLSLMGSNLGDYIIEANRVLKNNGILKISEVKSRFEDVKDFIKLLRSYGFKNTWKDLSHDLFYFMDFKKEKNINMKKKVLPPITLKSCFT